MAKRPLSGGRLWILLLAGLALLAWMWWNGNRRQAEFERASLRIQASMPERPGPGPPATARIQDDASVVTVTLTRMPKEGARFRWFWVRVGDTAWDFAYPDEGVDDEAFQGWEASMEPVWEEIRETLGAAREEFRKPTAVKGGLLIPASSMGKVPPGLSMRMLDLFLKAGYQDVIMESGPEPAPADSSVEADER